MLEFFADLGAWNWLIVAAALFILEAFIPGVFLLWFGFAAAVVGVIALTTDMGLSWQLLVFGIVAILTVLAARSLLRYGKTSSDRPNLNVRGQQYVGRTFVLESAIENGRGRIRVGDTLWMAEGPDLPEGTRVHVTGAQGTALVVEPASDGTELPDAGSL